MMVTVLVVMITVTVAMMAVVRVVMMMVATAVTVTHLDDRTISLPATPYAPELRR
jgi:hypothetical protein